MQNGVSSDAERLRPDCVFCQHSTIAPYILKETQNFRLVTDHAPLVEGHILIIPKLHYACYGAVPCELDTELFALRNEVRHFFQRYYRPPVFWEHGVFHQTVFHAHLHCFPFGILTPKQLELCEKLATETVQTQETIRAWYATKGQYFYLEPDKAFLYAPKSNDYMQITQSIFWPNVSRLNNQKVWHSAYQRQKEGQGRIEATFAKWRLFEQEGATYADEASA
jgi:diadenosine tetraphosphate (Ap4A) HIT family hydrolase